MLADEGTDVIESTRVYAIVQAAVFASVNGIDRKYAPIHANFREPRRGLDECRIAASSLPDVAIAPLSGHNGVTSNELCPSAV
jgi:hypothetical protein